MNWPSIGTFLANLLTKLAPAITAFFAGKEAQKGKQTSEELEAMENAKTIRERIDNDPVERERVRRIFDRDIL